MLVTAIGLLVNVKRKDLETKLKSSDQIGDFDVEELEKNDGMKDVMVTLKNPTDLRFVADELANLLQDIAIQTTLEE